MRAILMQMDLEEALLGYYKMLCSWTAEKKQKKDNKVMAHIHLHLLNEILQDVLREKSTTVSWL